MIVTGAFGAPIETSPMRPGSGGFAAAVLATALAAKASATSAPRLCRYLESMLGHPIASSGAETRKGVGAFSKDV
ncbi:MAG: hypothetical protein QM773_01350 [Hyphomonadaceae bacterium]